MMHSVRYVRVLSLVAAFLLFGALAAAEPVAAAPVERPLQPTVQPATHPVVVYFFWGDGCPHCAAAKPFLAELNQRYPTMVVRDFEVWNHPENQLPFIQMAAKFGFEPGGVPTTFIGDQYWEGFGEGYTDLALEQAVASCAATGCIDAGSGVFAPLPTPVALPTVAAVAVAAQAAGAATPAVAQSSAIPLPAAPKGEVLALPWIGPIDLATQSLVVSTALIAFVDGFNPCSLWVLTMLLALTLHTGSRRKVLIIGLVFITVTALVYVAFIAGLFTMFSVLSFAPWIQVIVALVALFFAAVNIKDYFWYKEGVSFTIGDEQKPGIYRSMRRVMNAGDSLPALVGATIVMAAGVSLVEFSCTAGFPVLWTNLLVAQGVSALTFGALLLLYMLIYQLDELVIFGVAVVTLRASKLEEKQGRVLKLISGMLMLALALVMLVNPSLMNSLGTALAIFGLAFGATLLVLLVHRLILPHFGIYIGTEYDAKRKRRSSHPKRT